MKNNLFIGGICICFFMVLLCGCTNDKKREKESAMQEQNSLVKNNPDCVDFIALWSATDIAGKLGKDKKWVFLNYTVTIWDTPPANGLGSSVGELRASSYARILATQGDDYKVESPANQVQGWLSSEHVKSIVKKNPKTRALCE